MDKNNTTAAITTTPAVCINMSFSRHLGNRYPNEQIMTDNCGSCDGAFCDHCVKVFTVLGKNFYDEESAKKFAESVGADLLELTGSVEIVEHYGDLEFFLNSENVLCVLCWWKDADQGVPCNTASRLYPEKLAVAVKNKANWEKCTCIDKGEHDYANSCCIVGCNDPVCLHEVLHKGRTEKKWYM